MNKKLYSRLICVFILLAAGQLACKKSDLLDAKPQSTLAIPTTVQDVQAMLDVQSVMNLTPSFGDASADNYFVTSTFYQSATVQEQNTYMWSSDIYDGTTGNANTDWYYPYRQVLYANIALETLGGMAVNTGNQATIDNLKGIALFDRGFAFFCLAEVFAPTYDSTTANKDLGIPLRLSSDINQTSTRASVQQTYDQVIADVTLSRSLLPTAVPLTNKNRPSLAAAFALLSRTYLSMREYAKAGLYADSALQVYNVLNDYNTVKMSTSHYAPYTYLNNNEVFYNAYQLNNSLAPAGALISELAGGYDDQVSVDTNLYKSYVASDLRKNVFYYVFTTTGAINLNGSYAGNFQPFSGMATNEMYLNRAECYARTGNTVAAMNDLNTLLAKRWKTGTFVSYTAVNAADALNQILAERRKELPFSSVRWMDLRRLNKEGYNITLTRIVNAQTYTLAPNDPKYVLPIPPDVIQLSGIQQNQR